MASSRRKKAEMVLPSLKLRLFSDFEPIRPMVSGIPCARCAREDVSLLSNATIGYARLVCEMCAIDEFREYEGYETREAAASARKRSVDTPLLLAELALHQYAQTRRLKSVTAISVVEQARIVADAHSTYVTVLSRAERREIETVKNQRMVERRLREILPFVGKQGVAQVAPVILSFTKVAYERLLVSAYLGNFMINGLFKDRNIFYDEVLSVLFSKAKEAGIGRFSEVIGGTHVPSREFSQHPDVRRFKKQYEDELFWGELVRRLADRDMRLDKGSAAVSRLSPKQYEEAVVLYEAPYLEEFNRHGLTRFVVQDEDDGGEREEGPL